MNYDDHKRLEKFVDEHVITCITDFANYLFGESSYADWDEWENLYVEWCPECGAKNSIIYDDGYICQECEQKFENAPESQPQEIYEYWIVDTFLGRLLQDKGEPIFERMFGWIWGRTTTGQAIYLDGVIYQICNELELLEGQRFEMDV